MSGFRWIARFGAIGLVLTVLDGGALAVQCPATFNASTPPLTLQTYDCPNGITVTASNVTLDCHGATLQGNYTGGSTATFGVKILPVTSGGTTAPLTNVTVKNCTIRGYFYGIRAEGVSSASPATNLAIQDNILSDNWKNPFADSQGMLVKVVPDASFSDHNNLGGGLFVRYASNAAIDRNFLRNQNNGMDLYSVVGSYVRSNDASDNKGWGIHLNASAYNEISDNHADRCNRSAADPNGCGPAAGGGGDSAGILLVASSHDNVIERNSFRQSGDGFFIGNETVAPSNNNLIQDNDGSCSPNNAFEATFSTGNCFLRNQANDSGWGFWLGYSHDGTIVDGNRASGNCSAGIEIEHGQRNTITNNVIESTANDGCPREGIVLRTNGVLWGDPSNPGGLPSDNDRSTGNTVTGNVIRTRGWGLRFQQFDHPPAAPGQELPNRVVLCPTMVTSGSDIWNNEVTNTGDNAEVQTFGCTSGVVSDTSTVKLRRNTVISVGPSNLWSDTAHAGTNVVGLLSLGGNFWSNYTGIDDGSGGRTAGDGLGDTGLPFQNINPLAYRQIASPGDPNPLVGRPFLTPLSGQVLDFEGDYVIQATTIPGATGYLIGLFQNGTLVYENYRDEHVLNQQVTIPRGSAFRVNLLPNLATDVTVRGLVGGQWTDQRRITVTLVPRRATVKVLELKYFPTDASGQNLDPVETGLTYTLSAIRSQVTQLSAQLEERIEEATSPAKTPREAPYLDYVRLASIEKLQKVPRSTQFPPFPDHFTMFNQLSGGICNYVDVQGVRDVWIWMYQTAQVVPITSNMAMGSASQSFYNHGSYGDVSNSYEQNDLPVCQHTYTVYEFNYGLDASYAQLDYSIQKQRLFGFVDQPTYDKFALPYGTGASGTRSCGNAVNPPNSPICGSSPQACSCNGGPAFTCGFIYNERQSVPSNCSDWHADDTGVIETVDCTKWNCATDRYHVWWGQRHPGRGTTLVMNGKRMRNWYEFFADIDTALSQGKRLTE